MPLHATIQIIVMWVCYKRDSQQLLHNKIDKMNAYMTIDCYSFKICTLCQPLSKWHRANKPSDNIGMICILVLIPTTLCEDKSILCCWMDLMLSVQVAGDFSYCYHCVQRFTLAFLSTRSEVLMDIDHPKCSANGSRSLKSNQNDTNLPHYSPIQPNDGGCCYV